ncbi:multidrug DMT transporter permease [Leifsonia shinshuensis]|uniref:multidrug DMT transporter permease n=1 Tax=Leifsonia shinshuensis TaxID=150026 RepID=UPI0028542815|nr:multidrug DMT transporter permease [Leifsonia shinshuensis]MDR6970496.1 drug/metabolite transporter (DMT)-like permease [Leifsonia shinshuensis]
MGTELMDAFDLSYQPSQLLGIPVALVGAVFLSVGAQLQHHGVAKVEATAGRAESGLNARQLGLLLARPSWVIGTLLLGLSIVFQLVSLKLSPIILVQPLGVVGLVITSILNARVSGVKLNHQSVIAVTLCVSGVGAFVLLAAVFARDLPVTSRALVVILIILAVVLIAFGVLFAFLRHRFKAIIYIVGAGVLYGFVATLAKVAIDRISNQEWDWLLVACIVALLLAAVLGAYFVQNAYSSGPPDLVIAGLTVIDPMVAVTIGIVVLNEAAGAPWWAMVGFALTGAVAVLGVFRLAKYHPQSASDAPVADRITDVASQSGLD